MGKHLTIKEKLNAEKELLKNREKISLLREQINKLKYRNKKLSNFLDNMKYQKSVHGGLCYAKSMTYKKYGKKKDELTAEEVREYNRLKQREHRSKSKITPDIFKTDGVKHIKITWGK